jgi:clan AA aspartic protease
MAHIYADVELIGTKLSEKVKMFVDTGSTRTIIPYSIAEQVGIFYKFPYRREVQYGDGNVRQLEMATIKLRVMEREIEDIVYLDQIAEPILGVETLELLGLRVDPGRGEIQPSRSWITRA